MAYSWKAACSGLTGQEFFLGLDGGFGAGEGGRGRGRGRGGGRGEGRGRLICGLKHIRLDWADYGSIYSVKVDCILYMWWQCRPLKRPKDHHATMVQQLISTIKRSCVRKTTGRSEIVRNKYKCNVIAQKQPESTKRRTCRSTRNSITGSVPTLRHE
ncbi:hypothetical protein K432DRAFT_204162 [Lepidopterella palustris CBS 459.81]|uniref:Uncharacterized protein n=1 Tax=Lepidopterella palustris CBS 459.81 TaxID=1314670 RepID=A0A8E2EF42_9PEZI|nr:hypothetical protein K432DRAFT_204162 [Lepidopterella palustris CBS 459.81]